MDWQALGTFVALVGVIGSFYLTWRGQRLERENADNTASRAEAAARLTEEYTARVVVALEAIAASDRVGAPTPPAVRWSLRHQTGDTFILENIGTATAEDVAVSADDSLPLVWTTEPPKRLAPDEALTFLASPSLATSDFTVTVTWTNLGQSESSTWRYPLPFRTR